MAEQPAKDRAKELRSELFGLVDDERELRRQLGERVLAGKPRADIRARLREVRDTQEDLSAAASLLHAMQP